MTDNDAGWVPLNPAEPHKMQVLTPALLQTLNGLGFTFKLPPYILNGRHEDFIGHVLVEVN